MSAESGVPGDGLILAAIDRADRHRQLPGKGVPRWEVLEHLAMGTRTHAARTVTRRLDALTEDGLLERHKRHGILFWLLTGRGRRQMLKANAAGELPESPQHRRWREAQTAAGLEVEQFRRELDAALAEGSSLLAAEQCVDSDAWFRLGEHLRCLSRRVGSAAHCLREWPEPSDEHRDEGELFGPGDEHLSKRELTHVRYLRKGRRNIALWQVADPAPRR